MGHDRAAHLYRHILYSRQQAMTRVFVCRYLGMHVPFPQGKNMVSTTRKGTWNMLMMTDWSKIGYLHTHTCLSHISFLSLRSWEARIVGSWLLRTRRKRNETFYRRSVPILEDMWDHKIARGVGRPATRSTMPSLGAIPLTNCSSQRSLSCPVSLPTLTPGCSALIAHETGCGTGGVGFSFELITLQYRAAQRAVNPQQDGRSCSSGGLQRMARIPQTLSALREEKRAVSRQCLLQRGRRLVSFNSAIYIAPQIDCPGQSLFSMLRGSQIGSQLALGYRYLACLVSSKQTLNAGLVDQTIPRRGT